MSRKVKAKTRGVAWTDEETLEFLSIWQDHSVEEQLEDPKIPNGGIYKFLAVEMAEKGYDKTQEQLKVRMHTLKRSYRLCKGKRNKSGSGRVTCKYYEQLDAILGSRPASSPVKVIEPLCKRKLESSRDDDDETDQSETEETRKESSDDENLSDSQVRTETPIVSDSERKRESEKEETSVEDKVESSVRKDELSKKQTMKNTQSTGSGKLTEKKEKKARKSRLEVALGSVMTGFNSTSEKTKEKFMDLEKQKLDVEKKRLDLERAKLDSEERQRREEREHQFKMMQMIMGAVGQQQQQNIPCSTSSHNTSQASQHRHPWPSEDNYNVNRSGDQTYFNL